MQEIFEKIIERLEERRGIAARDKYESKSSDDRGYYQGADYGYYKAIEIVNQVAEEVAIAENTTTNDSWIPVSERLPEYTQDYNVTVGVGNPFGYYETVMTFRFVRVGNRDPKWIIPNDDNIYTVLAWRELPAKYQPKGEK